MCRGTAGSETQLCQGTRVFQMCLGDPGSIVLAPNRAIRFQTSAAKLYRFTGQRRSRPPAQLICSARKVGLALRVALGCIVVAFRDCVVIALRFALEPNSSVHRGYVAAAMQVVRGLPWSYLGAALRPPSKLHLWSCACRVGYIVGWFGLALPVALRVAMRVAVLIEVTGGPEAQGGQC